MVVPQGTSSWVDGQPEMQAFLFSTMRWEPSFYQGLFRPWLRSVLRGGITYAKGLGALLLDQTDHGYSPPNR
jgi:hypothetical protein